MPITRQDVNNDITAKISGKTIAKSITPTDDGANRELMMDYLDQEIKVKVAKTIISEAEILQLFTTPITILDSTESGKIKYPTNIYIRRNAGTGYTLITNALSVINDFNIVQTANITGSPLTNDIEGYVQSVIQIAQNLTGGIKNNLYKLRANNGNPIGGTGDLDVYVTYVEITL